MWAIKAFWHSGDGRVLVLWGCVFYSDLCVFPQKGHDHEAGRRHMNDYSLRLGT